MAKRKATPRKRAKRPTRIARGRRAVASLTKKIRTAVAKRAAGLTKRRKRRRRTA